jgi:hypothetical protein
MTPRTAAWIGAVFSLAALGVAVAQIMPADRGRLPASVVQQQPTRPETQVPVPVPVPAAPPAEPAKAPPAETPKLSEPVKPAVPVAPPVQVKAPANQGSTELVDDLQRLDPRILKTRERLLAAARTGKLEKLLTVFQMNEVMPLFAKSGEKDPVAFWKKSSGDGEGYEILAILANILSLPPAIAFKGTAQEMVVWPSLAHLPLDKLSPEQSVDLYRLMTAQDVRDMKTIGKWVFWRVGIGKDGTLHYFVAGE